MNPVDLGGPLPQVDTYNTNQQRSLKRLISVLTDDLRLRDERADDFGVDFSLEVHVSGRATNIRGDAQLKSLERDARNRDGSLSFSADVSNIVYLLNGRSPLYVVYVLDTNSLLYAWVRDEVAGIESTKPDWKAQGTVTIRFSRTLDAAACEEIRDRILQEGVFRRQVSELVGKAASGTIHLSVDASTFRIAKPDEIAQLIEKQGLALVSSGAPQEVLEKATFLTQSERELPAVALALGYAEYTRGRYAACDGQLALARLQESALDPKRQVVLSLISNACDLELGRISRSVYLKNEAAIVGDNGPLARQLKAKVLWDEYWSDRHPDRASELVTGLESLLQVSLHDSEESPGNIFQLTFTLLTARTDFLVSELLTINTREEISERIDLPWLPQVPMQSDWQQRWDILIDAQKQLVASAVELRNPALTGRAKALLVFAEFQRLLTERLISIPLASTRPDHSPQIYSLMPTVESAQELAISIGDIEEEIRLTLRLADMFMALGNDTAAKRLASGTLGRARALRLGRLTEQAEALARGDWFVHAYEQKLRARRDLDEDELLAVESDEELVRLSRAAIHLMKLPENRLATILAEHEAMRSVARERLSFCRHLHVIQDLEHTREQETFYAEIPDQVCRCALYGSSSAIPSKDPQRLLVEFKAQICRNCESKSPKRSSPP